MLTVWRLVTDRFAATAFSGDGARLYGGRWNRKGVSLVYAAGSQSLRSEEHTLPGGGKIGLYQPKHPTAMGR